MKIASLKTSQYEDQIRRLIMITIRKASIMLLTHPQTPQTILLRYYTNTQIKEPYTEIMAVLYLACKLEETPRRLRDIITIVQNLRLGTEKQMKLARIDDTYYNLREKVLEMEIKILAKTGFNVHVEHPHAYIFNYLSSLG